MTFIQTGYKVQNKDFLVSLLFIFISMRKLFALFCLVLPLYAVASKYTQAMYEKATEPVTVEASPAQQEPASTPTYKDISGAAIAHKYLIVVGSFKERLNAANMVDQIMQKGEGNPYVAISPEGMHRVVYQSSDNDTELRNILASIKKEYPSAWILKIGD